MAELFFKPHEIQIYKRRRIAGTNRFNMSATFTVYPADIQPASQQRTEFVNGRFGATFTAFVESDVDVKEGDQIITIADSKKYSVKGVQHWAGAGLLDYIELILTAVDG